MQTTAAGQTLQPNRTEVLLSPRLGLVRTLGSHWSAHASGFRAFRTPSMNELYRTGQVGQETTLANAALLSERATGFEVAADMTTRAVVLQGTYFWTVINRPVSAVLVSQTGLAITDQRQNLGQLRSQGTELALQILPGRKVSGTVGYQYADAIVTKFSAQPALVGNQIPQVPRNAVTAQVRAASGRLGQLTVAMREGGRAFDDANNQFPLNGFFELGVSGSRRVTDRVDVFFQVENVTNQRQQVSRTPNLTLGTPVYAVAGIRVRLRP